MLPGEAEDAGVYAAAVAKAADAAKKYNELADDFEVHVCKDEELQRALAGSRRGGGGDVGAPGEPGG